MVGCLLTSGPNDVNPFDQVLAQSEKAFAQRLHSVSRLDHLVKLGDL